MLALSVTSRRTLSSIPKETLSSVTRQKILGKLCNQVTDLICLCCHQKSQSNTIKAQGRADM